MLTSVTRRGVLARLSAASLGGMVGASLHSTPARAGIGWGPGPKSGLPFWLGGYSDLDYMVGMMPAGRSLDLIGEFEGEGIYLDVARGRAKGWPNKTWHKNYLVPGRASAFQWTSSPFCSGPSVVAPTSWPSSPAAVNNGVHLNCSRPPTFTGNESASERAQKQLLVWKCAATGYLDAVWREKMMIMKRDYFIKTGLRSIKIVLRACHELNSSAAWGDRTYRRAYNMTLLTTEEGYNYVRQAIGRYFSIFTDVFGNTWSSIPNDYAYGSSQLWPYWNTNRSHKGPFDLRITCPGEAKLIGPDYYDHWPAHLTEAIFNEAMVKTTKQGWPVGLLQWLNWGRSIGKPLALGEIGLMTRSFVNGGRPPYDGWDNPEYVRLMLEFCKQNAADIGFVSYFNRDVTASLALPAHLIKPWTGIDTGANCVRNPPGDNNQCGARAFKQWMAANA